MAFVPSLSVGTRAVNGAAVTHQMSTASPVVCPQSPPRQATNSSQHASVVRMAAASDADVPDMAKRTTMNILLGGTVAGVSLGMLYPFTFFFVPKGSGGGADGVNAKDALGNDLKRADYLATHLPGSRELVQGLRGDATYLIVTDDKDLEYYGLNAVCTHLGCVVPWVKAENKFKCPCHGSQYSPTGAVVRGPAPLPLALERVEVDAADNIVLKSWKEEDFRTNSAPWWNF